MRSNEKKGWRYIVSKAIQGNVQSSVNENSITQLTTMDPINMRRKDGDMLLVKQFKEMCKAM